MCPPRDLEHLVRNRVLLAQAAGSPGQRREDAACRRMTKEEGQLHPLPPEEGSARAAEALWVSRGINGVPAVVMEGKGLISGGQPARVFEEAMRGS